MKRKKNQANLAVVEGKNSSTDPQSYGREIVRAEAKALEELADNLGADFDQSVETILHLSATGHVILSGMGKAGFVAMKLSATFASTGVPSFFLHPAEAVHGDIGRYTKDDLALLLSNSGETEEILRLIPQVQRIGCPIISITGDPNSTLARHSTISLTIGSHIEAGPWGLAPTTTTIAMMALGDALAMAVLNKRGLSRDHFAQFHPGGNIGRMLTPVAAVMRKGVEHCVVTEGTKTSEVLRQYASTSGSPGAATVVSSSGVVVGIFTDGDLRRCLTHNVEFLDQPISAVMGRSPKTVTADMTAAEALRVLRDFKKDQVIVIDDNGKPLGMLDIQDLIDLK